MTATASIREIQPEAPEELDWVARHMRETLAEVLGRARAEAMYDLDWLRDRVRQHLDGRHHGQVFVARDAAGALCGHTIVRVEDTEKGVGLFSTIYVRPELRRTGVATQLIGEGERWLLAQGTRQLETYTDADNLKLIRLFESRGYALVLHDEEKHMVVLRRGEGIAALPLGQSR